MSRQHYIATTDFNATSIYLREQIAAEIVIAVFVFVKRSAWLASSRQERQSESLGVEANN